MVVIHLLDVVHDDVPADAIDAREPTSCSWLSTPAQARLDHAFVARGRTRSGAGCTPRRGARRAAIDCCCARSTAPSPRGR